MFPPSQGLRLDIDAISQICGSVSIACWIVVFSPQIIENWKRASADGLSVVFIVVWLLGDFFNIIGAVLQGVLPTMIILAVYYTLADIVLLLQCFWYKGFTLSDAIKKPEDEPSAGLSTAVDEESPLLSDTRQPYTNGNGNGNGNGNRNGNGIGSYTNGHTNSNTTGHTNDHTNGHTNGHMNGYNIPRISDIDRRQSNHSQSSFRERFLSIDATHLSPATPLLPDSIGPNTTTRPRTRPQSAQSTFQTIIFNLATIILVCASGVFGWWLSARRAAAAAPDHPEHPVYEEIQFSTWGQISGYVCAALYLGSRIPQLLLNYRRKSTEGISMLFFLFACIGNLTYVLSIVAYKPVCQHKRCGNGEAKAVYMRYIAVNASWLLGSFGTLLLDAFVFIQYFMYRKDEDEEALLVSG